eukprot:COSAG06_NODE_23905_length_678_cov_1.319516_1_plen_212_part_10
MQMCAASARGATSRSDGCLFACDLTAAMRLNRAVIGGEGWAARAPLGVEALLAHLLAVEARPGWAVALLQEGTRDGVDTKQLNRLVRALNRIHRTRGQRRKKQNIPGAAEASECRAAVDSTVDQGSPGSVALCALVEFFELLRTPLVDPELMLRVLDHFRSTGPLGDMDAPTRNSVCRGLHGHTQLGLLDDPLCRMLVERTVVFAHDFAVAH